MAKAVRTSTSRKPKSTSSTFWMERGTIIIEKIGLSGFGLLFMAFLMVTFGTLEQKQAVIDRWLLFKYSKDELPYACFIFAVFLALFFITIIFYESRIRLMKERLEMYKESENNK